MTDSIEQKLRTTAKELLEKGEVKVVIGWGAGRFPNQVKPLMITSPDDADKLVWNEYCLINLPNYLLDYRYGDDKIAICVHGCGSRAVNRLLKDKQITRERLYLIGLPCPGMKDRLTNAPAERCATCRHHNPVVSDMMLGEPVAEKDNVERFAGLAELEAMTQDQKYEFWAKEFDKCIRCYACRNVCPACNCVECFADQYRVGWQGKQKNRAENQIYGLTRAYHISDRCIECGECERACPMNLPLMKLNRALVKELNNLFGKYEAGLDDHTDTPLGTYNKNDLEEFM